MESKDTGVFMSSETRRYCMVVHARYPVWEPRVQREARALIDAGYEVDVICLRQPGEPARERLYNKLNVYRLPLHRHKGRGKWAQILEYLLFFFLAWWQLIRLHFRRHYRIVHIHNPPDFLVFIAWIPRLMGAKVILDLHDLMPEFYASRFKSKMNGRMVRLVGWQEQLAVRFADHIITVTEPWRQTLIRRGLSPNKCSVVMNVADSRVFRQEEINIHQSRDDCFHLIYHGNLSRQYGLDLALQAIAQLKHDLPGIYLTIHGRGAFLDGLQQLSDELELEEHVHFSTNHMPIEDLPAFIARADVGLVPYRRDVFVDGILPTKLMEYAALGMPVIAAYTPTISTYFDETMLEFFIAEDVEDLARCIQTLFHNSNRLNELAVNIQKFNRQYDWETQKLKYINLVNNL